MVMMVCLFIFIYLLSGNISSSYAFSSSMLRPRARIAPSGSIGAMGWRRRTRKMRGKVSILGICRMKEVESSRRKKLFPPIQSFVAQKCCVQLQIIYIQVVSRLTDGQIRLQRLDVCLERMPSHVGDAADGAGTLAFEGLLDFDVACCREFVNLHAQVARRGSRLLLDVREFSLVSTNEQRHHSQSQLRMQQRV